MPSGLDQIDKTASQLDEPMRGTTPDRFRRNQIAADAHRSDSGANVIRELCWVTPPEAIKGICGSGKLQRANVVGSADRRARVDFNEVRSCLPGVRPRWASKRRGKQPHRASARSRPLRRLRFGLERKREPASRQRLAFSILVTVPAPIIRAGYFARELLDDRAGSRNGHGHFRDGRPLD